MNIPEDTKELKTPSGEHTILVKAYLTGEDRRAARRVILKVSSEDRGKTVEGIEEVENHMMSQIVLKIDDSDQDIVDRVLKMKAEDYDFVVETINQISQGKLVADEKKEEKSDGSTKASSEGEK